MAQDDITKVEESALRFSDCTEICVIVEGADDFLGIAKETRFVYLDADDAALIQLRIDLVAFRRRQMGLGGFHIRRPQKADKRKEVA